jgi:hypothetical protein
MEIFEGVVCFWELGEWIVCVHVVYRVLQMQGHFFLLARQRLHLSFLMEVYSDAAMRITPVVVRLR